MNILFFSVKNILFRWWRSLSIGLFIFLSTIMMLFFYSFVDAIKQKIDNVMINGMIGHIQIRSDRSYEQDMVATYHKNRNNLSPIHPETVKIIKHILNESFTTLRYYSMVRYMAYLNDKQNEKNEHSLLIGIDPDFIRYKDSFQLIKGKYLSEGKSNEIIITSEQAKKLNLHVGEELRVKTKNISGLTVEKRFMIVGIGEFPVLSFFSYKACYVDVRSLQDFIGLDHDEISNLIIFLPSKNSLKKSIAQIRKTFEYNKIEFEMTNEEKIKSEDIKIKSIDLGKINEVNKKIKISTYLEMGKMFKSVNQIIFMIINILLMVFLIIIGLLITNMVVLMTIERFNEIGTLRAIGFPRFQIIRLFISEIMITTLFFTLLGLFSGALLLLLLNTAGISFTGIVLQIFLDGKLYLLLKPLYFIIILLIINIFSFLSSFIPVYKACRIKPVEILRNN